jgi:type III secretory pathway component EscT
VEAIPAEVGKPQAAMVHDCYFMARFATTIWWLEGGHVRVLGDLVEAGEVQGVQIFS